LEQLIARRGVPRPRGKFTAYDKAQLRTMLKLKQLQQKQQLQRQNPAPEGQVAVFSDNTQTKEVGRMFSLKQEGKQKKEKPSACRLRVQVGMCFY